MCVDATFLNKETGGKSFKISESDGGSSVFSPPSHPLHPNFHFASMWDVELLAL